MFLEASPDGLWRVLCKTRGKLRPGDTITLVNATGNEDVRLELGLKEADGTWIARPLAAEDAFALLDRVGRVPLPPYIRHGRMVESDREQYQTVYAQVPGAVAAPTAGLHFTTTLLQRLVEQGRGTLRSDAARRARHLPADHRRRASPNITCTPSGAV